MARRTRNGATDPYITRRVGGSHRKAHRQAVVPIRGQKAGVKDGPETMRALTDIGREARAKEEEIASSSGPHSLPDERHYPQSFRVPLKKEEE